MQNIIKYKTDLSTNALHTAKSVYQGHLGILYIINIPTLALNLSGTGSTGSFDNMALNTFNTTTAQTWLAYENSYFVYTNHQIGHKLHLPWLIL